MPPVRNSRWDAVDDGSGATSSNNGPRSQREGVSKRQKKTGIKLKAQLSEGSHNIDHNIGEKTTSTKRNDESLPALHSVNAESAFNQNKSFQRLRLEKRFISPSNSIEKYERLNHIEEGSYGIVFRARRLIDGQIVAVKRLKLEKETSGFPVTSLREICTLMTLSHSNIVHLQEVCIGELLKDVYIIMEYVEHDLKSLLTSMKEPFLISEIKTIMIQILSATEHMHSNWIIHRDLKTTNVLMTNRGQVKIADFGLARFFSEPAPTNLTQLVVTLWYRAPEILLGSKSYSSKVDIWSIGCIFAELISHDALLKGRSEIDQIGKIFDFFGAPTRDSWPEFNELPHAAKIRLPAIGPRNIEQLLQKKFLRLTRNGANLMSQMLTLNPDKRISAEEALKHPFFIEPPIPKLPDFFPSFPSKATGHTNNDSSS